MINPIFKGETAIICCTGFSINQEIIDKCNLAKEKGLVRLFGINLTYREFNLDVLHACNSEIYDHYLPIDDKLRDGSFDKWTTRPELINKYSDVNYIEERWADGFSVDPEYIHAHHGSSPQIMNIASLYGIKKMLLIGFDMRYQGKVSNREYKEKRHYFGEYAPSMRHYPRTGQNGEFNGLIEEFKTIDPAKYNIEIINCTPNSALKHFPMGDLEDHI